MWYVGGIVGRGDAWGIQNAICKNPEEANCVEMGPKVLTIQKMHINNVVLFKTILFNVVVIARETVLYTGKNARAIESVLFLVELRNASPDSGQFCTMA